MKNEFDTPAAWLIACSEGQPVAIMPASLAAEVLGESANALTKKLKRGDIPCIIISERRFIPAEYVHEEATKAKQVFNKLRHEVERVARRRSKIFYGDLMQLVEMRWQSPPDRTKIGFLLGELSRWSFKRHGILLSSIVHRKSPEPTTPGPGYMTLVTELAKECAGLALQPGEDEAALLKRHMAAVWDHYSKS